LNIYEKQQLIEVFILAEFLNQKEKNMLSKSGHQIEKSFLFAKMYHSAIY
jgi:hypothetical protein